SRTSRSAVGSTPCSSTKTSKRIARATSSCSGVVTGTTCMNSTSQLCEGGRKIRWILGHYPQCVAPRRVLEGELLGMQPLPGEAEVLCLHGVGAVRAVSHQGVPHGVHVHPDLVRPAGLKVDLHQGGGWEHLEHLVVRDRRPSALDYREFVVRTGVAADG